MQSADDPGVDGENGWSVEVEQSMVAGSRIVSLEPTEKERTPPSRRASVGQDRGLTPPSGGNQENQEKSQHHTPWTE